MMKYEEEATLFPHHDDQIIYRFVFKIEIDRLKESPFFLFLSFFWPPHAVKSIVYTGLKNSSKSSRFKEDGAVVFQHYSLINGCSYQSIIIIVIICFL